MASWSVVNSSLVNHHLGRIDAEYYKPESLDAYNYVKKGNYKLLGQIVKDGYRVVYENTNDLAPAREFCGVGVQPRFEIFDLDTILFGGAVKRGEIVRFSVKKSNSHDVIVPLFSRIHYLQIIFIRRLGMTITFTIACPAVVSFTLSSARAAALISSSVRSLDKTTRHFSLLLT